jgi:hypothetical protein
LTSARRLAGRASYDTLLAAGVRIYEWQPTTLHAKTFVVDGEWTAIGSVGQEVTGVFVDDLRYAHEITAESFNRRSWWHRLLARGANLATRLL